MADSFTKVSSQSWGSRIGGSFKGILFGIALFLASFAVLWWNEGNFIHTKRGLEEGLGAVIKTTPDAVLPENDGKLVYMSGETKTEDVLVDEEFGISENAIKLSRDVEMYQWTEESESEETEKIGGGTETTTTYTYNKTWESSLINSDEFEIPEGHSNPQSFPYNGFTNSAETVTLGAFELSYSQIGDINNFTSIDIPPVDSTKIKTARMRDEGGQKIVYLGKGSPSSPEIGDTKISFSVVYPGTISIVSQQHDNTFEPYQTQEDTQIDMVSIGNVSAENMFASAQQTNVIITWVLRLVGFLMMFFGLRMVFAPLEVLASVLPFLGRLVGMGVGLIAGMVSGLLSFVTIAIAWLYYRPLIGIALLAVGVGIFILLYRRGQKKKLAAVPVVPQQPTTP
ncbi:MAG: hypothetical protein HC811_05710 [Flammeovirgaceae bacterium]|nr:hypothetical protein [Flammeovirgaceae bacterium]